VGIATVMVVFFLVFPRAFLRAPGMVPRSGPADQGSMLDSVLDPARRALAASSRVLFHIQGERLGYLRCLTLTTFDGARWSGPPRAPLKFIPYVAWEKLGNYSHRQVRVKNAAFLGRVLPVDGDVVFLYGRFFGRPMVNAHGGIETDSIWNTANNEYQYWIDPQPPATPLPRGLARLYVQHPEVSARITNWLDQVLVGATNSYDQARRLEHHLQTRFAYELGAPELNRANFTEEFLFEQRRGHCERFASALTLLLRVKGIPSRVVIGYLPTSRNSFSGGYNIRFRDAHAWTEAWFPERGWVTLDGTPRAQYPPEDWNVRDLLADLDFACSAYVVNFDAPTQSQFLIGALQSLGQAPGWLARHWKPAVPVAGIALALGLWFRLGARRRVASPGAPHRRAQTQWAEHYYGQMLRALARAGLERQPHQTPLEFLNVLGQRPLPVLEDARRITDLFCATRYGGRVLSADQRAELQRALHQIRLTTLQAQSARTRPGKAEPPL
jgi:hypothetical protein